MPEVVRGRNSEISIHAPREGGDAIVSRPAVSYFAFQSTPPARGATAGSPARLPDLVFQSTPPARGATNSKDFNYSLLLISIHAPREGGDSKDAQFYL